MGITDVPAGVDTGEVLGLQAALRPSLSDVDDLYRFGQDEGQGEGSSHYLASPFAVASINGDVVIHPKIP
jgi:hypothetical protein